VRRRHAERQRQPHRRPGENVCFHAPTYSKAACGREA
jgi:hypothetical protein